MTRSRRARPADITRTHHDWSQQAGTTSDPFCYHSDCPRAVSIRRAANIFVGGSRDEELDMKAKRLCAMLVSAAALVIALVGTTGCTNLDQYKSTYVGTWELYSADFEGTSSDIDHNTYVLMSETYDMHATIDFDSDGNCLVDTFGTQYTGTWKEFV